MMRTKNTIQQKQSLFLLGCLVFLLGATACSKQKRIENKLEKVGKWDNTIFRRKTITYNYYSQHESTMERYDAGYMGFEKNGNFIWLVQLDGQETIRIGTWKNTKEEIILTEDNSEVWNFKIKQGPKKTMRLECVKNSGSSDPYQSSKHTFTLDFRKSE